MKQNDFSYLYESKADDFLLNQNEENILRALRRLDKLYKKYLMEPHENILIIFGGGNLSVRVNSPSEDNEIESFSYIICDGGDGGDSF